MKFMDAHDRVAHYAMYTVTKPRFKMPPKIHMFAHVIHDVCCMHRNQTPSLNILVGSCQMDEDLIGKVSCQSRQVSIGTVSQRTIQRHRLNLALKWCQC